MSRLYLPVLGVCTIRANTIALTRRRQLQGNISLQWTKHEGRGWCVREIVFVGLCFCAFGAHLCVTILQRVLGRGETG